jgi:hypothetical protein
MTIENIAFGCQVQPTNNSIALGLRVVLDQVIIFETAHVTETVQIEHEISDDDGEHVLTFELFGKQPEHTKITEAGEIVSDALIEISNITLDGIDLAQIFQSLAVYHHNFNGSQAPADHKFYRHMGCNGIVTLKFTTPVYLWLLENM